MFIMKRFLTLVKTIPLVLLGSTAVLAADPAPAPEQPYPWPFLHTAHEHTFWWIFPLMFFIFMIVMFIFMMRRGGWGCMWCNRWMGRSESGDIMKPSQNEPSETALDILNKRYAKGEIDKAEYEEKKAEINR